jgi:hypothetical protein
MTTARLLGEMQMGARSAFKQNDVTRAIRAAQAAGWRRVLVDTRTGVISIDDQAEPELSDSEPNPWDDLLSDGQT